eukprot:CAMPEP_0198124106 /NCGR_PEP_ID=MMETSP1442-20131203/39157_1 /TAXON_ID= /ORGANISM="Craspedostauros australis, Strain CCMP3328" /LENGTH=93 /DNA_ID=CAMNT_0043783437 /DNA_START=20 /DNA_END=297 /DNA_ORIENTATION=-
MILPTSYAKWTKIAHRSATLLRKTSRALGSTAIRAYASSSQPSNSASVITNDIGSVPTSEAPQCMLNSSEAYLDERGLLKFNTLHELQERACA